MVLAAAAMAADAVVAAATPAGAQEICLEVTFDTTSWTSGTESGGFIAYITLTDVCAIPSNSRTLEFTLPQTRTRCGRQ